MTLIILVLSQESVQTMLDSQINGILIAGFQEMLSFILNDTYKKAVI